MAALPSESCKCSEPNDARVFGGAERRSQALQYFCLVERRLHTRLARFSTISAEKRRRFGAQIVVGAGQHFADSRSALHKRLHELSGVRPSFPDKSVKGETVSKLNVARLITCLILAGLVSAGCQKPEVAKAKHLEKGKALAAKQNYAEAILEFKNAIKIDAKYGEARYALAKAYEQSGQPEEAVRQYVAAGELLPTNGEAQTKAAVILLVAREFERAKQHADAALKIDPKNLDAQIAFAMATAGLKDVDSALKEMQEAIQIAPGDFRPYMSLGSLQASVGQAAEAEASFKRAVELAPRASTAHTALGYYYWMTKRLPEAEKELQTAASLAPEDTQPNRLLALFYMTQDRMNDAETPLLRLANKKDVRAVLVLGDLYVARAQAEKARPFYASIVDDKSVGSLARSRLAGLDYAAGKVQEAHASLEQALKADPTNVDLLTIKTRWYLRERRVDEALAVATDTVKAAPSSAAAQYALGLAYVARQQNAEAIAAFKETLRLNPQVADAQMQLSRLMIASGRPDEALSYAESARRQNPSRIARASVISALLAKGQRDRADAEVRALLKEQPQWSTAHVLNGILLTARGDHASAAREFDRALELDSADVDALTGRVTLDLGLKRPADGRARLARALAANPSSSPLLVLAARFENSAGDRAAAERYLRKSIEVDASNLTAYALLGQMYVAQKRLDEARTEFERIVAKRPDNVGVKTMIGIIYDMQQRQDESRRVYEEVVRASPRAGVASNNLAYAYASRGEKLDAALQLAQTAKQQMPETPEVDDTLGFVYYKKNLPELAIPPLQLCTQKDPNNPTYHFHLGLAYAKAGMKDKAQRSLEKALTLKSDFAGADEARSTLASLKG
jgi:tetratricopeptide (TPR) repeat protein